jgi:hypothetical protein
VHCAVCTVDLPDISEYISQETGKPLIVVLSPHHLYFGLYFHILETNRAHHPALSTNTHQPALSTNTQIHKYTNTLDRGEAGPSESTARRLWLPAGFLINAPESRPHTVQCSAVQCMQCSAVQCSAVQCSAPQSRLNTGHTVQCSAVHHSPDSTQCMAVHGSAVHHSPDPTQGNRL